VAAAGTVIEVGPKLPFVPAAAVVPGIVLSKEMITVSDLPKPAPETFTVEPGGPVAGESTSPAPTVNLVELVTVIVPTRTVIATTEAGMAGTMALIWAELATWETAFTVPNDTAAPRMKVTPDPVMSTLVPGAPEVGAKEILAAAAAGVAEASAPRHRPMLRTRPIMAVIFRLCRRSRLVATAGPPCAHDDGQVTR
jgi:hypothetical protein